MSTKIYTAQKFRPYKVEVFGLQDDYIGTLQSFADLSIGRVQDSKVTLSKDGTQEFTCSIPRFYINPKTNEKIINPRWEDIKNGVLAENTRVLKVFVIEEGETKVYPFIVDKIIDKRDSHFSVYKEITASGLAFAELGKVGLRLELNKDVVEADYKKDKNTVATLNYWLDKVFPRDESGRWLTPWSYEIRMDWSNYSDKGQRETNKMYDDIQVDKWTVTEDGKLIPAGTSKLQEKARYINSDKGSNKYNITQTIAETFGVFCVYEYKCEPNGQFVKTYVDESGHNMTGRTAVFYNRAIKTDNPFTLDYQKNLQSISRTCDTSEIYTKLFVDPIQSDTMTDGYVTIANTAANPSMDEFILNFDYLYSKGSITEYQKDFIDKYSVEIHKINEELRNKGELINLLTVEINDKKAEKAGAEKSVSAIQEELTHYQTLRDNDVTNTPVVKDKNNSYSVAFVKDNNKTSPYYRADLRLEGILSSSINGYKNYKYEETIFTYENLISSQDFKPVAENDENMYVVLDEDGYAVGLYTGYAEWFKADDLENDYIFNTGHIVYLALQYSPHNKYVEVCNRFERMIVNNKNQIAICNNFIESKQAELDELITSQSELLAKKDSLNQKLEYIMGPALREGHWSAEDYEDIGRKTEATIKVGDKAVDDVSLVFGTELFDGEEKGYYYASAKDVSEDNRTYYDYIDISSYITNWKDKNPEDLVIHLTQPEFRYTVPKSQVNGLAAGNYFILYNMTKYYFRLEEALKTGNILRIQSFSGKDIDTPIKLQMSTDNGDEWTNIDFEAYDEEKNYANLTDIFEGLNKYLSTYKIYPNAGFIYGFISQGTIDEKSTDKTTKAVKPVLLLNNPEINYSIYKQISCSFGDETTTYSLYKTNEKLVMCYPRIVIAKNNVNHDDDLLTITEENVEKALVKFEDYSVLLRNGQPRFNLKITKNTTPYALLNKNYTIVYRFSQANEMLYRDALEVARENSRPRFSYDVSVAQLPDTVESYELGQLGYINDSALGVKAAKGYISSITLVLDSPKDDEIQIQNYKTKFEDLFATITASSEAMKSNQQSYDIAASIINPSTGSIQGSILQDSFNNNKVELTYSNTQVHIDDTDGITLTNTEPYSNGVYGQVVMRGGGIFLSNTVDSNYNRIWTTGITPNGINASTITTGQLDANLVRIFAGNNVAFQWNSEGIYAYKRDENNQFLPNTYVRYSDKGLQYIDDGDTIVDLGWNGLTINSQDGSVSLTGEDGLIVYDGQKNEEGTNHVVSLGRFGEEGNYSYGLKLYKKDETGAYVETLSSDNNGQLWLKDYLAVGGEKESNLSYQWQWSSDGIEWNDSALSTAKQIELKVPSTSDQNGYQYRCLITHFSYGEFYTEPATLKIVQDNFYISKHPSTQTASSGSLIYYTVEAVGTNKLNYQWQVKQNKNNAKWSNSTMTGSTTNTMQLRAITSRNGYVFRVIVTDEETGKQLISEEASLYIVNKYEKLIITEHPHSVGAFEDSGSFVSFSPLLSDDMSGACGISGLDENNFKSVRFWAGESFANRANAPFRVLHDGSVYASKLVIGGNSGDTPIQDLIDQAAQLSVRVISTAGQIYNSSEENPTTILLADIYLGEVRLVGTQLDDQGYINRKLICQESSDGIEWKEAKYIFGEEDGFYRTTTDVVMDPNIQYRAKLEYSYFDTAYEAISPPITFTMVSNGEGLAGVGITHVTEYYYTNNIETVPGPELEEDGYNKLGIKYEEDGRIIGIKIDNTGENGWQTDLINPTEGKKYLWNIEKTDYSDGNATHYSTYTQPALIARYTEGESGRGITRIENYYVANTSSESYPDLDNIKSDLPTQDDENEIWWTAQVQKVTAKKPYLWNYEKIIYDKKDKDGKDIANTDPAIIGMYGKGIGVTFIEEYYLTNDIGNFTEDKDFGITARDINNKIKEIDETLWQKELTNPDFDKPKLWNIEKTIFSNGDFTYTEPALIAHYTENGVGISGIENWYRLGKINADIEEDLKYSPSTPSWDPKTSGWEMAPMSTRDTEEERGLWNFEKIIYTKGEPEYTKPALIGTHGATGDTGASVSEVTEYYLTSDIETPNDFSDIHVITDKDNKVTKIDIGPTKWGTTITPANKDLPYIWNIEKITYSDDRDPTYTLPVIIARYTEDGRGIVEITNWYCLGNATAPVGITAPGFDYDTIQRITETLLYPETEDKTNSGWKNTNLSTSVLTDEKRLWNFERIVYSDNTYTCTTPVVIGVHGSTGGTGKGINAVTEYYYANNITEAGKLDGIDRDANSVITKLDSKYWTTTINGPNSNNTKLWNIEKISYSSGDPTFTEPTLIAFYTKDGRGIDHITEYYMATNQSEGVKAGEDYVNSDGTKDFWSTAVQSVNSTKKYLWNYEVITYDAPDAKNSYTEKTEACIIGVYGDKGDKGDDGRSIDKIEEEYAISSSDSVEPLDDDDWDTELKSPTEKLPYLWARERITYKNYTKPEYTSGRVIATYVTDGVGIEDITNYYLAYYNNTGITAGVNPSSVNDHTWEWAEASSSNIPQATYENPFLWNYELITYTDGSKRKSSARIIGTYGPRILKVSTAITEFNKEQTTAAGEKYYYYISTARVLTDSGVLKVFIGDILQYAECQYPVTIVKTSYIYAYEKIPLRGTSILKITTEPVKSGAITANGFSSKYRIGTSTVQTEAGVTRILIGDIIESGSYHYPVGMVDTSYVYLGERTSISGRGITNITEEYAISSDKINAPTKWGGLTNPTSGQPYLWAKETITYNQAPSPEEFTRIIATYAPPGKNGTNGRGISSIENYYITTDYANANSLPSFNVKDPESEGWLPTLSPPTSSARYLWNVELIHWTSEPTETSTAPRIISVHGESGEPAVIYHLQASSQSIARDLIEPLSPTQVTFKVQAIEGKTSSILEDITGYELEISECKNNTERKLDFKKQLYFQTNVTLTNSDETFSSEISSEKIPGRTFEKDETIDTVYDLYYVIVSSSLKPGVNASWKQANNGTLPILRRSQRLWVDCAVTTSKGITHKAGENNPTLIYHNNTNYNLNITVNSKTFFVNSSIEGFNTTEAKEELNKEYLTKNTDNWVFDISSKGQNYAMNGVDSFNVKLLDSNNKPLDQIFVSFTLGDDLKELGKVENGEISIKDGKVRAESIAAYAITAGKIAAGAIETGGIAAGSELYLYTPGEGQKLDDLPKYEKFLVNDTKPEDAAVQYSSAVKETLVKNYEASTGGKMKLSSEGVEMIAGNSNLSISPTGINGTFANFASITINNEPINQGPKIITGTVAPGSAGITEHNVLYFQYTQSSTSTPGDTYTTIAATEEFGENSGFQRTNKEFSKLTVPAQVVSACKDGAIKIKLKLQVPIRLKVAGWHKDTFCFSLGQKNQTNIYVNDFSQEVSTSEDGKNKYLTFEKEILNFYAEDVNDIILYYRCSSSEGTKFQLGGGTEDHMIILSFTLYTNSGSTATYYQCIPYYFP